MSSVPRIALREFEPIHCVQGIANNTALGTNTSKKNKKSLNYSLFIEWNFWEQHFWYFKEKRISWKPNLENDWKIDFKKGKC